MPDINLSREAPRDWNAAFSALPLEHPAGDGWARIAPGLLPRHRQWWPAWLATAAALLLGVALLWRQDPLGRVGEDAIPPGGATAAPSDPLATLHAESGQLEGLLALARDDRVASGSAAVLGDHMDSQLARIDRALGETGLSRSRQLSLWRERVDTLRTLASFESNRRWLAAHGERYDGTLVQID